jgi:GT2 family glycosyltransferase
LHLCSNTPLSVPPPDFLEGGDADWEAHASAPAIPPVIEALQLPQEAQATKARSQAVALVERLMQLDEQIFAQHLQIARLDQKVQESRPASQAYFDIPRTKQAWPLADNPALTLNDLDLYDQRVDDAAVLEARAGEAFFARFSLFDTIPDLSGAIAALNRLKRSTRPAAKGAPDVSIIIPIYGQLAYTLNCLESLLPHVARASFEIIIVDDASLDQSGPMLAALRGVRLLRQGANAGFIDSCNAGAAQAKGRFVLFLNNDTRVVPGWLDALVESFVTLPEAGLVGSKLLYPDGSLQEAGGIIWRDGSAWNNGRNDDPNRPHYSYAREVDYISGCSILLRTDLWRQLGGFDPYYAPAYCEDADLALRIRALGLRVWFQPQSQIIHYEGKTSGTDAQEGVKAYQVINARKLFLRWREQLAGHRPNGEAPFLERERRVRKRALIIDATAPTPKQDAGSVTTSLTLKLFQQLGYKAHFVPQDNFLFQREYSTDLQAIGIEVAYAPYELDFESYIRRYGWSFDVVLVYRVTVLDKVLDDLRRHAPQAPVLFHNMDLHYLRMGRQAELSNDPKAVAEAEAMKARELGLIARVDCTITHSTYERDLLHAALKLAPVVVWPFMFEFHGTTMGFAERRDFIFLGGYGHAPNVDAVMFFVRDVLPLIKLQEPSARFIIAGARPSPEVLALASSDVIVTGMVDDLRTVFDTARVFACSLRIGAGTKGKVSTAMAYGLPVVSTACGAEGMDLVDGEEVLLADTAADFAAACLRVYRDPALWQLMSEAGMRLVQEKHSLAMGRRVLGEAIEAAWRHKLQLGEISHAASSANTTSTTPSATI